VYRPDFLELDMSVSKLLASRQRGLSRIFPVRSQHDCTIATHVALCVGCAGRVARLRFGTLERYGEVLCGAFISLVGFEFGLWRML
jgi:hypothetical protein